MAQQFDVYRDWLGVTDPERPLNYYQLLRVPKFEDNGQKIRANYCKLNAHVHKNAAGKSDRFAALSQKLLNELAAARLCRRPF